MKRHNAVHGWAGAILCLAGILTAAGTGAGAEVSPEGRARPGWLVGIWHSESESLRLEAQGGYTQVGLGPAGAEPSRITLGAGGRDTWWLETRVGIPDEFVLRGIEPGWELRRGPGTNRMVLRDPVARWDLPFWRVDGRVDGRVSAGRSEMAGAERLATGGDLRAAGEAALRAVRILRDVSAESPLPAASAAFLLARIRQDAGRGEEALLWYDESLRLRTAGGQSAHPQFTRGQFFAGQCAEALGGYERSLVYFAGAFESQHEVLRRIESATNLPDALLQSVRAEQAAVCLEAAGASSGFGFTDGVVVLFPEAARLARLTGEPALARIAAVGLFSHLMAREESHDHSRLLLSAGAYLESLEASRATLSEEDLLGKVLREARIARELAALDPPRADLARPVALRAAALGQVGIWKRAPYVPRQILPGMVAALGLSNAVSRIPAPPAALGAAVVFPVSRAELGKYLDTVAQPVDLPASLPEFELQPERFPSGASGPGPLAARLKGMRPALRDMAKRPEPAELESKIQGLLAGDGR